MKRFFLILILSLSCSGCTAQLDALDRSGHFFPGYLGGVDQHLANDTCFELEWSENRNGVLFFCQQDKLCGVACHE